jgi:hypothetical protein
VITRHLDGEGLQAAWQSLDEIQRARPLLRSFTPIRASSSRIVSGENMRPAKKRQAKQEADSAPDAGET